MPRERLSDEERKARHWERKRAWYEANRERAREQNRAWHKANRERERERSRAWREANPERARESNRARYEANRERTREQTRARRKANPDRYRELMRQANHRRRALKARAIDTCLPNVSSAAINRRFWLFGNACAYCGSYGSLHLDHVDPLARGGLHTPRNLVPACGRCNLSKGANAVEAWYLSQPFFSPERWKALQTHTSRQWSTVEQLTLLSLL